jgi:hypothetical protein
MKTKFINTDHLIACNITINGEIHRFVKTGNRGKGAQVYYLENSRGRLVNLMLSTYSEIIVALQYFIK